MRILPLFLLISLFPLFFGCGKSPAPVESAEGLRTQSRIAIQEHNYAAAEEHLGKIVEQDAGDITALLGRAGMRLIEGNGAGAAVDYAAAAKLDPSQAGEVKAKTITEALNAAQQHILRQDMDTANKIIDALLVVSPSSGSIWHESGIARFRKQDYPGAISSFTKAIEFDDGNNKAGDSYAMRAAARRASGDAAGAKADEKLADQSINSMVEDLMHQELMGVPIK